MTDTSRSARSSFQHDPTFPPPPVLRHWWVWALLAAILVIPFFLPISQDLRRHPIIGTLGDQVHIPLLACLTLMIYWKGPLRGRLWLAAGTTAVLGGVIEFVQEYVGRAARFGDWILDLIGIGLVVGLILWRGHGKQQGKWLLFALLIYIPGQLWFVPFAAMAKYEARLTFPVIADFQTQHHRWLWTDTNKGLISFADADSSHGQVLRLEGGPPSSWPGARMVHFSSDWTGYTQLVFEARAQKTGDQETGGPEKVRFGCRIDDYIGRLDKVWATQSFWATTEWQTFTMQVAEKKVLHGDRLLDLTDVESILFFGMKPEAPFILEIDNVRLQ